MAKIGRILKKIPQLKPAGFWPGFLIGVVYFSYIFWWFWPVYYFTSLGIESVLGAFLLIFSSFVVTVVAMSLFWGIFSYTCSKFLKDVKFEILPIACAGIFTFSEYLRSWFFGILWFGKNSLFGAHWTLGNLSYLFVDINIIRQSSAYWGIYGITFLIIFLVVAVFALIRFWQRKSTKILALEILSVFIILVLIGWIVPKEDEGNQNNKLVVSAIQTKNPIKVVYEPEEILNDFSKKIELLKEAAKNSDIIIFPENADFSKTLSGFLDFASAQKFFNNLSRKNILLLDSNRVPEKEGVKSRALLLDSKNGVVDFYDKKLLTPGGESLPYIAAVPLMLVKKVTGNNFVSSRATFAGGARSNVLDYNGLKLAIMVCSDIISPYIAASGPSSVMVHINNLAIFNGNRLIENQLLAMARYRAAENRKDLVITSNYGRSFVINIRGNIRNRTNSTGYEILTGSIVPNQDRTWYNKLGDWPILLLSLAILGFGVIRYRNVNQNKSFYNFSRTIRRFFSFSRI